MGLFEQHYDQFLEFSSHTPAQRYLQLLDRYPRITDMASYRDIATYLNISRRQLQRIRESKLGMLSKDENINPGL